MEEAVLKDDCQLALLKDRAAIFCEEGENGIFGFIDFLVSLIFKDLDVRIGNIKVAEKGSLVVLR
jgi:hypothetical protein